MVLLLPEFSDTSVCGTEGIPASRLELSTQRFQPDVQVCDLQNLMGWCCWTGKGKEPPSALVPAVSTVWMCWGLFLTVKTRVCPWLCVTHPQFERLARCELGVLWSEGSVASARHFRKLVFPGLFCKSVNLSSAMAELNEQKGHRVQVWGWGGRIQV